MIRPMRWRKAVRHYAKWTNKVGGENYAVTYEDLTGHEISKADFEKATRRDS